jgi:hypothetical protein
LKRSKLPHNAKRRQEWRRPAVSGWAADGKAFNRLQDFPTSPAGKKTLIISGAGFLVFVATLTVWLLSRRAPAVSP